jgi:cytochrome c-type biogenesis protein CcmH/NrfG
MKTFALLAVAGLSLSACAANRTAPIAETGYAPGALALAAIERQDWTRAERLLLDASRGDAEDPARLINLGEVYWQTGRHGEAIAAWRRALASDRPADVETRGGRWVTTDQLAREALSRTATASLDGGTR